MAWFGGSGPGAWASLLGVALLASGATLALSVLGRDAEDPPTPPAAQPRLTPRERTVPGDVERLQARVSQLELELARARSARPRPASAPTSLPASNPTAPAEAAAPSAAEAPPPGPEAPVVGGDPDEALLSELLGAEAMIQKPELWLNLAWLYFHLDRLEDAIRCLEQALLANPDVDGWMEFVQAVPAEDRIALLQRLSARQPQNDELWGKMANAQLELGQTELAIENYLRALELDSDDSEWLENLAGLESDQVLYALEQMVGASGEQPGLLAFLGKLYLERGRVPEALERFAQAYLAAEEPSREWLMFLIENDRVRAAQVLETYARAHAEVASNWVTLGDVLQTLGRNADAAEAFRRALALEPDSREHLGRLAQVDPQGALGLIDERRAQGEEADWGALGTAVAGLGRAEDAVQAYLQAIQANPRDADLAARLAEVDPLTLQGLLDERNSPHAVNPTLWAKLGDAYASRGMASQAADAYRRAMVLAPDDNEWPQRLGSLDPAALQAQLESHQTIHANSAGTWAMLGDAYAERGQPGQATQAYLQAMELDSSAAWLAKLAVVDPQRALGILGEQEAEAGEDDEVWGDLGDTYLTLGQTGEALRCYRRAHQLDSDDREWIDKLEQLEGGGDSG